MKMKYAKSEFTNDSLPSTRKQQFKAIFKNEWKTLLLLGLLFLIPFLLLALLEFVKLGVLTSINNSGAESSQIVGEVFYVELIYNALLVVPYVIFGLILAGTSKVLQRLIYGEGLLFKGDFIYGIKHNFKQIFVLCLIYWFLSLITSTGTNLLSIMGGAFSVVLSGVLIALFSFILTPIIFIGISFSTTYKMSLKVIFSNSFKIFISFILVPLLYAAILFGLSYLDLIPSLYLEVGIQAIIILLLLPLGILIWKLYMTSIFDSYINENAYPEIYCKGLKQYNFEKEN